MKSIERFHVCTFCVSCFPSTFSRAQSLDVAGADCPNTTPRHFARLSLEACSTLIPEALPNETRSLVGIKLGALVSESDMLTSTQHGILAASHCQHIVHA